MLRANIVRGCHILNADPFVFEVILEYLESRRGLNRLRWISHNPLTKLALGTGMILRLVKAWHIAHMLDNIVLQNKLVDTFREAYLHCLESSNRISIESEPFMYLQDHLGTHTKIEKFIIDFYAGVARIGDDFSDEELQPLSQDIARTLKHRRTQLVVRGSTDDLIANHDDCFNVNVLDQTIRSQLQVVRPYVHASVSTSIVQQQSRCGLSASPTSPSPTTMTTFEPNGTDHHVRLSLPGITSINGQADILVSRTLLPVLQSNFGIAVRPTRQRRYSMMTMLPNRAPFMNLRPISSRRRASVLSEESSSDGETKYGLFPARLTPCEDLVRNDKYGVRGVAKDAKLHRAEDDGTKSFV